MNELKITIQGDRGFATINGKEYETFGGVDSITSKLRMCWVIENNPGVFNEDGSIKGMHDFASIKQPEIVYE